MTGLTIDAFTKEQNPTVQGLVAWLKAHADRPKAARRGALVWHYAGWTIEHRFGGSGEDSSFSMEFTPLKVRGGR